MIDFETCGAGHPACDPSPYGRLRPLWETAGDVFTFDRAEHEVTHQGSHEKAYLGIRVVTPLRGMLRVRDELLAELYPWLASRDIEPTGPFFLRLHVIDMEGPMDLEVGVACRYEAYLTDPRTEPRKTKWEVELNMRVA